MAQTVVKIENLVKRYKELIAVDHFDLEIRQGEVFGLLGPNGSGKTTAAKLLNALVIPVKGRVIVDGLDSRDKSSIPEIRNQRMFKTKDETLPSFSTSFPKGLSDMDASLKH